MSINMRILPLSDKDIEGIAADLRTLSDTDLTRDAVDLYDHWREIDYLLGGQSILITGDVQLGTLATNQRTQSGVIEYPLSRQSSTRCRTPKCAND